MVTLGRREEAQTPPFSVGLQLSCSSSLTFRYQPQPHSPHLWHIRSCLSFGYMWCPMLLTIDCMFANLLFFFQYVYHIGQPPCSNHSPWQSFAYSCVLLCGSGKKIHVLHTVRSHGEAAPLSQLMHLTNLLLPNVLYCSGTFLNIWLHKCGTFPKTCIPHKLYPVARAIGYWLQYFQGLHVYLDISSSYSSSLFLSTVSKR